MMHMDPIENGTPAEKQSQPVESREPPLEVRARELATLLSVQQAITSRLDRQEVLQMIAEGARQLVASRVSGVYLLEGDTLCLAALCLDPQAAPQASVPVGYRIPLSHSIGRLAIERKEAFLVPDVRSDPRVNPDVVKRTQIHSYLAVPLLSGNRAIGLLFAADKLHGELSEDDERVLSLLATSAVIGLENARLYQQAEENAALAERSRLARELHDAVTQTLFSASLIAEVLPEIWEIDPQEGRRRLAELRTSVQGALAEMRALLLELRPESLLQAEPRDLFRHLINAFTGRTRVPVRFTYDGSCPLQGEVKVSLYRIAQEALNNIARHADASQIELSLLCLPEQVRLEIQDDGVGFLLGEMPAEHLGLRIMQERAEAIGSQLAVESRPGQGTTVRVVWNREGNGNRV